MCQNKATMAKHNGLRVAVVFAALNLLAFPDLVLSLYSAKDSVVPLTAANFEQLVIKYDGAAMVEFFAPWCGHCQALVPHYKKVAEKLKGIAFVGAIDCDDANNKKLCAQYQIRGFPTIKIFPADKQKNPYTGDLTKQPEDYQGPRTAKPMLQALEAHLTDVHITKLASTEDLAAFRKQHADKPQVLLFSSKDRPTPLYSGLSMQLQRGLAFALVPEAAEAVVKAEGVGEFPLLKVIKPDGEVTVYDGEMKGANLKQFLDGFMPASAADPAEDSAPAPPPPPPAAANAANLTLQDLAGIDAQEDMWLVAFFAASAAECQEHIVKYLQVVKDLEGTLKLGVLPVPAEQLPQLPEAYGLDKAALAAAPCEPKLVMFPFGGDKQDLEEYQVYQGALEAKEVQKWALQQVPDFTSEVTASTYAQFLGAGQSGGATGAGIGDAIRVFLFTNKPEAPPVYRALAAAFRGKAKFIFGFMNLQLDANKEMVQVAKVPMMALAIPNMKDGQLQMAMEPFNGPLKLPVMYAWLRMMAQRLQISTDGSLPESPTGEALVPAVGTPQQFQDACATKPGICVIGLFDAAAPGYSSHIEALMRVAATRAEQPLHFLQVDAPTQPALIQALGVMRSDLPTVAALSPKRLRFVTLQEPFSEAAVGQLLEDLLAGRARTTTLLELPEILDGVVDPQSAEGSATGADAGEAVPAEEQPVEEEFDLSDILNEDIEGDVGGAADKMAEVDKQLQEEAKRKAEEAAAKQKAAKKKKTKKKTKKGKAKSKKAGQGDIHDEL